MPAERWNTPRRSAQGGIVPGHSDGASGCILIATIMRRRGFTGVQIHSRLLEEGIRREGILCHRESPFSGSAMWLAMFALRPLVLHRLNKDWSTRWYRHWHFLALRENLACHVRCHDVCAIVAESPLAALAALQVRERCQGSFKIVLVCHFPYSQAQEFRDKGELSDPGTYRQIMELEASVLRSVDEVVYVSNWSKQILEEVRGIQPKSSTVIWNGIAQVVTSEQVARRSLGLGSNDLVLINVGTLLPYKNQLGLIDLFAAIASDYPQARLLLVGDGPQRSAIKRKVAARGLSQKVKLLGNRSNVPALLDIADLYIHYATAESFGTVLVEAARAGIPSADVPVGGILEVQRRLQGSIPLDASHRRASLEVLKPLLDDPAMRADVGRRAQINFRRYFTQEAMVDAYLRTLRAPAQPRNVDGVERVGDLRPAEAR